MAAYLLDPDGERGPPLPFLKGSITRAQLAEKRKAKSSKGPRKVLPLVAQGSALATVYPEANKPAGTGVFIDEYNTDICNSQCTVEITVQYNGQVLSGTPSVNVA